MSQDEESEKQTPRKLVYQAFEQAAEERQRVNAAPLLPDNVIDTEFAEVQYHAAILEYFSRLKPHLPDRPEFWNDVPLWNEPLDGRRHDLAASFAQFYGVEETKALALLDALETNENWPEIQPRNEETVCGLKNLVHWRGRTTSKEVTKEDVFGGESTETVEVSQHLPREVAMRVHDALDEAAAELGYNTRPGRDTPHTNLDNERGEYTVEEVANE